MCRKGSLREPVASPNCTEEDVGLGLEEKEEVQQEVSSQVKCIDVTQRSVTLVIANPRSFGYEELHTLPKVPEEYY